MQDKSCLVMYICVHHSCWYKVAEVGEEHDMHTLSQHSGSWNLWCDGNLCSTLSLLHVSVKCQNVSIPFPVLEWVMDGNTCMTCCSSLILWNPLCTCLLLNVFSKNVKYTCWQDFHLCLNYHICNAAWAFEHCTCTFHMCHYRGGGNFCIFLPGIHGF